MGNFPCLPSLPTQCWRGCGGHSSLAVTSVLGVCVNYRKGGEWQALCWHVLFPFWSLNWKWLPLGRKGSIRTVPGASNKQSSIRKLLGRGWGWITVKRSVSYTALQQSYVSCNHPHLGHVTEVPGSPYPIASCNFCKFPAANSLSSPFWLWLQLLLDFWSHSHLTSRSWSLPSALSCPRCGTWFPFSMLYQKEKYTHIQTPSKHYVFISLSSSYEKTDGFYITMLLGSFTLSRHFSHLGGVSPSLRKLNSPHIIQGNLALHPPTSDIQQPTARVSPTMNHLLQVPLRAALWNIKKFKFWTFTLSPLPFCGGMLFSLRIWIVLPFLEQNWLQSVLVLNKFLLHHSMWTLQLREKPTLHV